MHALVAWKVCIRAPSPFHKVPTHPHPPGFRSPPDQLPRYNEIAELVVAAAQRRALQQRAARQGLALVPGDTGPVVKVCRGKLFVP